VRYSALNTNQLLNYEKIFGGDHKIKVLLGHETKQDNQWVVSGSKMGYYDPYNPEFVNAASVGELISYTAEYAMEAYLSRLEYEYDDRYYFSGSFRRDASSKFHPDVRWGTFWSVGAAWRINEESFMSDVRDVNNLKLKASYGTQGNDGIAGAAIFYSDLYEYTAGANPVKYFRGNTNLTWEKSNNFNVGVELGLFDRLDINADFFIKETRDLLYQKPLFSSLGAPDWIWDNQIDMKNTGFEVEINADIIKNNNFKWDVSFNLTYYKNKLTKLPDDKDPTGYTAGNYWRKLGGSLYDWYTYEYAGVDPATGAPLWYMDVETPVYEADGVTPVLDSDGNPVTTTEKVTTDDYSQADRYEIGKSAIPDLFGGLSTGIELYGFDFNVQTAFQLGGYGMDIQYQNLMGSGSDIGENFSKDIYKRWTPSHTDTDIPYLNTGDQDVNATSSRWLTSSSYFSIRNITLGYTVPKKTLKTLSIDKVRLFVSVDNLWIATARKGFDPRQSFNGTTYIGAYSALKTASVGLQVNF